MSIGAALTIVSSPYIQSNASEFDCCQEQIIGKCLSVLKMKQTKMAEGLLTKSKGKQHQNQTAIAQPTFFFLITLGRETGRLRNLLKLVVRLAYKYITKQKVFSHGNLKSKIWDN